MAKFLLSFTIIGLALTTGYVLQQLVDSGRLKLPLPLDRLRIRLQQIALLFVLPVTVTGAIWVVSIEAAAVAALPLIGFGALVLGGVLALVAARLLGLPPRKTGALFACGSFTNIGAVGALICYLYLGEAGFALVPIYKIFEELTYYGIGFPIAKYYSQMDGQSESTAARLKRLARDPFILVALGSLTTGGLLNLAGVPRPSVFAAVNAVFIPLGTSLLLVSIGLAMKFRRMTAYLRECCAVAAIKFILVPMTMASIAIALGYGDIDNGLPLKVVIILTAMPVAFNALIPPSIYSLDLDLANACWLFSTAGLVIVLPLLLTLVSMI
jgi:predicted permease